MLIIIILKEIYINVENASTLPKLFFFFGLFHEFTP